MRRYLAEFLSDPRVIEIPRIAWLPILHGIQAEFGYVDQSVIPLVAKELNLSRADVHGTQMAGVLADEFGIEVAGREVGGLERCAVRGLHRHRGQAHAETDSSP